MGDKAYVVTLVGKSCLEYTIVCHQDHIGMLDIGYLCLKPRAWYPNTGLLGHMRWAGHTEIT